MCNMFLGNGPRLKMITQVAYQLGAVTDIPHRRYRPFLTPVNETSSSTIFVSCSVASQPVVVAMLRSKTQIHLTAPLGKASRRHPLIFSRGFLWQRWTRRRRRWPGWWKRTPPAGRGELDPAPLFPCLVCLHNRGMVHEKVGMEEWVHVG